MNAAAPDAYDPPDAATVVRLAPPHGRVWMRAAPVVMALLTFAMGVTVIVSGVYPVLPNRLPVLSAYIYLPLVEVSHVLASLSGLGLMVLAHGLARRSHGAWLMALGVLLATALLCVLRALDVGVAGLALLLAAAVFAARAAFYRPARALVTPISWGTLLAVAVVIGVSLVAGLWAYADDPRLSHVFSFGFDDDVSRFWRATVVLALVAFAMGLARLQATPKPQFVPADAAALQAIVPVIAGEPSTHAWLALMGDKQVLRSDSGRAFVMYGVQGRTLVVLGDPCGAPDEAAELVWRLRELADQQGARLAFVHISADRLPLYLDLGLSIRKLGEEARVDLHTFHTEGKAWRNMRNNRSALLRRGIQLEILPASAVDELIPELQAVSDHWRTRQHGPEKGFSLGRFDAAYLRNCPLAVMRLDGQIVAFANLWLGAGQGEISVDLMRHLPDAPHGVMDVMFIELMLWAKAQGYRWFNLGRAPLSGLVEHPLAPVWHALGGFVFRRAARFYRFEGLRLYKQKFGPQWRPFYLAAPPGWGAVGALVDMTALISGPPRYNAPRLHTPPQVSLPELGAEPAQDARTRP